MTELFPDALSVAENRRAAVALYPNQGLHEAAAIFAASHNRGVQYLQQAPVLVFAGGDGSASRQAALFVQIRFVPLADRGAPLKEVMAAFGFKLPMRKLKPFALSPGSFHTLRLLNTLDPSLLGRVIPEKPGEQRQWISACGTWIEVMGRRVCAPRLAWAADRLRGVKSRDAADMADFAGASARFSEAWGYPRAVEEMHRWHADMDLDRALKNSPIQPDTVCDFGNHPDAVEIAGLDFVALRTPRDLAQEGAAMRHCVFTYLQYVSSGSSHIVGVRRGGERVATLELSKTKTVKQLRGPRNAVPPESVSVAAKTYVERLPLISKRVA